MSANEQNVMVARQAAPRAHAHAAGHDIIVAENLIGANSVVRGVQEVEDELTQLQLHIDNGDWAEAMERTRSHPSEIMPTRSQGGNGRALTAVHLACESGECPLPLLRAMLTSCPQVAGMVDRDGNTPLHNACGGQFAYDPATISLLLIAYPQAVLMQENIDQSTPLHLLLVLGGDVNVMCVRLLLDVAYSKVAGLPRDYVPLHDFCGLNLAASVLIAASYPPVIIQLIRQIAIDDPYYFPKFLEPFIHLSAPTTLDTGPQLLDDQQHLLMIRECNQQTPLHSACACGSNSEVIWLLTNEASYPGAHEAARWKDRKDRSPIFYAGCYGVPFGAIKRIYDLFPEAVHRLESYRILPLHITYIAPTHAMEDRKLEIKKTRDDPSTPIEDLFVQDTAVPMWRMYDLFLRLTYHDSYQDPPPGCSHWRVLHAAASIPSPPQFIRSAIRLFPWQVRERDEQGYLPVQRAAMCLRTEGVDENQYWLNEGVNQKPLYFRLFPENRAVDNPITIFVNAYPDGAQALDKDFKLPLHWAIETGKQWNEGVQTLVKAAPLALATRDGQHHMYPFMMAAMNGNVGLTFKLLMANPMIVQSGILCKSEEVSRALQCPVAKKAKREEQTNGIKEKMSY